MDVGWSPIARVYDPLKAGSIDGTDVKPYDHGIVRAMEFFAHYGDVKSCHLVRDVVTGFSKRYYAFVEFYDTRTALAASAANQLSFDDCKVFWTLNRKECCLAGYLAGWMAHIFQARSGKSLVILDEFGKGTKLANGIGLLVGTVESFLRNPATCPHTLLATHFHTVHGHLPVTQHVTYLTFESIRHEGELVYLHHLREGRASSSCASVVGQAAGLSVDIVQRQRQIMRAFSTHAKLVPREMTRKEAVWNKALPLVTMLLDTDLSTPEAAEALLKSMSTALK